MLSQIGGHDDVMIKISVGLHRDLNKSWWFKGRMFSPSNHNIENTNVLYCNCSPETGGVPVESRVAVVVGLCKPCSF